MPVRLGNCLLIECFYPIGAAASRHVSIRLVLWCSADRSFIAALPEYRPAMTARDPVVHMPLRSGGRSQVLLLSLVKPGRAFGASLWLRIAVSATESRLDPAACRGAEGSRAAPNRPLTPGRGRSPAARDSLARGYRSGWREVSETGRCQGARPRGWVGASSSFAGGIGRCTG